MVKTKLNIKSRKRSIQEPDLKKFKTEKASVISEDVSGMSTPVSKSKTSSSKTKVSISISVLDYIILFTTISRPFLRLILILLNGLAQNVPY
jgi:hypothetical protein